jgi:hypothetical protein
MHLHRFSGMLSEADRQDRSIPSAHGFVMCPLALQPPVQGLACPWQQVYELAFAQAQAEARSSLMERFQMHSRN